MHEWLQALRADGEGGTEQEAQAATELERRFNKKDFVGMTIHGQFNKGFIMASSGRELFIIDQHASDEKFNFERLQDTLVLNKCAPTALVSCLCGRFLGTCTVTASSVACVRSFSRHCCCYAWKRSARCSSGTFRAVH